MNTDIVPYSQPSNSNNSLNIKAVIISAAVSVCFYQWTVSAFLLFSAPLFVLVFFGLRKEFLTASALVAASAVIASVTGSAASGTVSLYRCAVEILPLITFLLPMNIVFCIPKLRLRYQVLISGSLTGVLLASFIYLGGAGESFIGVLHDIADETAQTLQQLSGATQQKIVTEEQLFEVLYTSVKRLWLFLFVFLTAINVMTAWVCRSVFYRRKHIPAAHVFPFYSSRWCSVLFAFFLIAGIILHYAAPDTFAAVIAWNGAFVLSIPAALAGWSVTLRFLQKRKASAALVFGGFIILSLFVSFFCALLYIMCAAAGIADSWYPLCRTANSNADPTPGDGKNDYPLV